MHSLTHWKDYACLEESEQLFVCLGVEKLAGPAWAQVLRKINILLILLWFYINIW